MKERPILFSGAMVRALLDGSKTQTRRVVKCHVEDYGGILVTGTPCPYGQPSDQLWVRESHWYFKDEHDPVTGYYPPKLTVEDVEFRADGESDRHGWYPSIHMPRWASRITLEITGVRVERLRDISEDDCWAEGVEQVMHDFDDVSHCEMAKRIGASIDDAKPLYAQLWESINGPGSWDANPWVWCVSFKVMKP